MSPSQSSMRRVLLCGCVCSWLRPLEIRSTAYFKVCLRLSKHYIDITIISTGVALNEWELIPPLFRFFAKEVIIYLSIACKATESHSCLCVPARASGQEIANVSCSLNNNQHCLTYTSGKNFKKQLLFCRNLCLKRGVKVFHSICASKRPGPIWNSIVELNIGRET